MGPDASLTPENIQSQSFASGFRGYDPNEVRAFLARVASELRAWRERAESLESAWHAAEERAARPPVLDEESLMAVVGEETAAILRSARAAAADLRARAMEEAGRILATAREEASRLTEEASDILGHAGARAESEVVRLTADSQAEARRIVELAEQEAEAVRAAAEHDRLLVIEQTEQEKERILAELAHRRRVVSIQIEQLRAGRERLIQSYGVVRRTLEEATSDLARADAEARAAAADAGARLGSRLPGDEAPVPVDPLPDSAAPSPVSAPDESTAFDSPDDLGVFFEPVGGPSADEEAMARRELTIDTLPHLETVVGTAVDQLFERIRATRAAAGIPGSGPTAPEEDLPPVPDAPAAPESFPAPAAPAAETPPPELVPEPVPEPVAVAAPVTDAVSDPEDAAAPLARGGLGSRRPGRRRRTSGPAAPPPEGAVAVAEPPEPAEPPGQEASAEPAPEVVVASRPAEFQREPGEYSDVDEALLQQREMAVVDLEVTLARRLKRALQDEQNEVLDRLRNLKGRPAASALLPAPDVQVSRYAEAARPLLEQAAAAGSLFAVDTLGLGPEGLAAPVRIADLVTDSGRGVVGPLRRRLEAAIEEGRGDDPAPLVEALGAAYREWKTQRIERLAGDVLYAAFSRGTWETAPPGTPLRWVVEDIDGPCPDCDDDALAGELPKGESFPTGQHHPPAHSGCRCLLVAVPGT